MFLINLFTTIELKRWCLSVLKIMKKKPWYSVKIIKVWSQVGLLKNDTIIVQWSAFILWQWRRLLLIMLDIWQSFSNCKLTCKQREAFNCKFSLFTCLCIYALWKLGRNQIYIKGRHIVLIHTTMTVSGELLVPWDILK